MMNIKNKNFKKDGYLIIPNFINKVDKKKFINLSNKLELEVKKKYSKINKSKFSGVFIGNLGVHPGDAGRLIYKICLKNRLNKIVKKILGKELKDFQVIFGGNLSLPLRGSQIFHIDGKYDEQFYIFSIATSKITKNNGPTEVVSGSHQIFAPFWKFCLSKKKKKLLELNIGDLSIRYSNLWHRGTYNKSNQSRFLMSFFLFPKSMVIKHYKPFKDVVIHSNFFDTSFVGKFKEIIYAKLKIIYLIITFFKSFIMVK